ncbi:lysophospholipid acyltransferase family protein [Arenicella sp. 4NH20-0111]|uniref:lysophospholipid acyltransferase family protein n=1 Tax=Arenicella sp. 4NH20-0111 TaxID=3127648 RepID=UPI003340F34A
MIRLLRTLQYYLKMFLVALWCTLVTLVFYVVSFPFNHRKWLAWAYAQALNVGVRFALRVKVHVVGRRNMIAGPAVVIMNHQSNFDPLLQGPVFPKNAIIIGKKELMKIPLWGRLFYASNNIMVDRQAKGKNGSAVELSVERLQQDDCYIWIFPEGTRSQGGKMNEFKNGAFRMAVMAQVPIIPMVSKPLMNVLDVPNKIAKGGSHEIKIMPAIETTGMSIDDVPMLMARCVELYKNEIAEYTGCRPDDVFNP